MVALLEIERGIDVQEHPGGEERQDLVGGAAARVGVGVGAAGGVAGWGGGAHAEVAEQCGGIGRVIRDAHRDILIIPVDEAA